MEYFDVNQETKEPEIKKTKKFNAKDEKGKNYEIKMELTSNSIIFKTEINDGILSKKYSNIFLFDKLKENILFAVQENIEEIYEQLEIYINDNPVSCEIKENIIIKLTTKVKKIPEIIFELKQKEIGQKQLINILIEKINILEAKNKDMESKITNLESKISSVNSENISLKKEIEQMKSDLSEVNEYIKEKKEKEKKN